ncbi:MAG TPA: FxsA family protein [Thermoanaerobaculia bacterium]|nr:FxsA family protein [Thermoanaerobaculia bacterium]
MLRVLLLFTLVPFAELVLLLWIGDKIGFLPTVALILATGVAGAALARHQGLATWRRFQAALAAGRLPGTELLEGLLILVAGALLLTPGVLTDAVGFLLLVPPARRRIVRLGEVRLRGRVTVGAGRPPGGAPAPQRTGDPEVIDAEFDVLDGPGAP